MNIIVPFKVVPDDQDITAAADGSLDYSRAHQTVSMYDLNAIEAAAQLAAKLEGSQTTAISVGGSATDDSKLRKNVLARGIDQLIMLVDDAAANLDSHQTAVSLQKLVAQIDAWDLIICGDGSADDYNQQVDVQLASLLDVPVVNAVTAIEPLDGKLKVQRVLENLIETVLVPLPAVISVSPDVALPRICGMKDILAAGKKPASVLSAADVSIDTVPSIETIAVKVPAQVDRKQEVFQTATDGDLEKFVSATMNLVK